MHIVGTSIIAEPARVVGTAFQTDATQAMNPGGVLVIPAVTGMTFIAHAIDAASNRWDSEM